MQVPLQITFRHMESSPAVEARVRELAARLERHYDAINSCRVVIDTPPAHRHKGAPFSVRIDVTVPGAELFATSDNEPEGRTPMPTSPCATPSRTCAGNWKTTPVASAAT